MCLTYFYNVIRYCMQLNNIFGKPFNKPECNLLGKPLGKILGKPLFLIGLRASGKTVLGKILSEKLVVPLYDTDLMIKNTCGQSIAEIVDCHGWQYFRDQESSVLKSIPCEGSIVSTGGGIILDAKNRNYLKNNGICIFLDPPIQVLCDRLTKTPLSSQRPAFAKITKEKNIKKESMEEEVMRMCTERKDLYLEIAHLQLDSSQGVEILTTQIQEYLAIL